MADERIKITVNDLITPTLVQERIRYMALQQFKLAALTMDWPRRTPSLIERFRRWLSAYVDAFSDWLAP